MSIVFVHAPEVVSLLASILFPYRLPFSRLSTTPSPSSVFHFHLKATLFSSFLQSNLCFFARYYLSLFIFLSKKLLFSNFLAFLPASSGRRRIILEHM